MTAQAGAAGALPSLGLEADFFALLDLPRTQIQDPVRLEQNYRALQARVHPDRHVQGLAADQRLAMQWATRVNEAWRTLRSPLSRARYLLDLLGQGTAQPHAALPVEFLMAQMEWREQVAAAKQAGDLFALRALNDQVHTRQNEQSARLTELIDVQRDYAEADAVVQQLMFLDKLRDAIAAAEEALAEA